MTQWLMIVSALTLVVATLGQFTAEPPAEKRALGDLVRELKDPRVSIRPRAAKDFGKLDQGPKDAIPALILAIDDVDSGVRAASAKALGKMGAAAKAALVRRLKDDKVSRSEGSVWVAASQALGSIGADAAPQLIEALNPASPRQFVGAAVALHDIRSAARDAVPVLKRALEHDHPRIRKASIFALGGIGPEAKIAVPALTKMLKHEDFHTQSYACRALGEIGPAAKSAADELIRLTKEGVASVRCHAVTAIGNIGPASGAGVVGPLVDLLNDHLHPVREDAAIALGKLGTLAKPAVPVLEKVIANQRLGFRVEAAKSVWLLTGRTEKVVPVLIEELKEFDHSIESAQALSEIGPPAKAAVTALVEALKSADPEMRMQAVEALGKIGLAEGAVPALEKALRDEDVDVRVETKRALKRIKSSSQGLE